MQVPVECAVQAPGRLTAVAGPGIAHRGAGCAGKDYSSVPVPEPQVLKKLADGFLVAGEQERRPKQRSSPRGDERLEIIPVSRLHTAPFG